MTHNSQPIEDWTTQDGQPVYWLAPEFWNPKTGIVTLLLDGEIAHKLTIQTRIQRTTEFLKLQGDPRYCSPEMAARMKRLMVERLGTDTPWRTVPPNDKAVMSVDGEPIPVATVETNAVERSNPFA